MAAHLRLRVLVVAVAVVILALVEARQAAWGTPLLQVLATDWSAAGSSVSLRVPRAAALALSRPRRWGYPGPYPGHGHGRPGPPPWSGWSQPPHRGYFNAGPPVGTHWTPTTPRAMTVTRISATTPTGKKSAKACNELLKEVSRLHVEKIFNGRAVRQGKFPHMALLGYLPMGQQNLTWNCGGALISRRFVVTAAHCFSDRILKAPVRVRLGEHDLLDDNDHAVDYVIKRWVVHPDYRVRFWYHDLALIELAQDIKFSQYIQPACLWTRPQDPPTGLIIIGWGSTQQDGGPMSNVLLEGNGTLQRVEPETCINYYSTTESARPNKDTKDTVLCMMDVVGSVDTCQGDSGGPVQVLSQADLHGSKVQVYRLVGVISGGSRWCGGRAPSVNTRLQHYLGWIEGVVWPN